MNENPDQITLEDVLQSSELTARLLRRLTVSPGIIDVRMLRQLPARLVGWIARRNPLLDELSARYSVDEGSATENQPLVMEQPWMVNINAYLTNENSFSSTTQSFSSAPFPSNESPSARASLISIMQVPNPDAKTMRLDTSLSSPAGKFRVSRSPARRAWEAAPAEASTYAVSEAAQIEDEKVRQAKAVGEKIAPAKAIASNDTTPIELPLARTQVNESPVRRELPDEGVNVSRSAPEDYAVMEKRQPARNEPPAMTAAAAAAAIEHGLADHARVKKEAVNSSHLVQTGVSATTSPTALPLVQKQAASSQLRTQLPNFVWRKSTDEQTMRDLLSAIASGSPLQTARRSIETPTALQSPQSSQNVTPEPAKRKDEQRADSAPTTERILRSISRKLLIERERRGY